MNTSQEIFRAYLHYEAINNMNETIFRLNISSYYVNFVAIIVDIHSSRWSLDQFDHVSSKCTGPSSPDNESGNLETNDMAKNNFFGLFWSQTLQNAYWQFGKSIIGWSKNCQRLGVSESVNDFADKGVPKLHQVRNVKLQIQILV